MPKAIAFGTFDGIHEGHRHFLDEAASYGDLRVVVALDATVENVKGRPPIHDERSRLHALRDVGYDAVLGDQADRYAAIEAYRPDVVCLGYDQQAFTDRLETELKSRGVDAEIVRLEAHEPETYKSSKLNDHPHTR